MVLVKFVVAARLQSDLSNFIRASNQTVRASQLAPYTLQRSQSQETKIKAAVREKLSWKQSFIYVHVHILKCTPPGQNLCRTYREKNLCDAVVAGMAGAFEEQTQPPDNHKRDSTCGTVRTLDCVFETLRLFYCHCAVSCTATLGSWN